MIKVKTFTTPIKVFATVRELAELDETGDGVPQRREGDAVYAVGDSTTTGDNGETIGLMRVVAYSTAD